MFFFQFDFHAPKVNGDFFEIKLFNGFLNKKTMIYEIIKYREIMKISVGLGEKK